MSKKNAYIPNSNHPTTLILGVYTPSNPTSNMDAYFEEFLSLVDTLGLPYDHTLFIKVRSVDSSHFLTKGKLQEIVDFCHDHNIEEVICSEILSPLQERNFSNAINAEVFDRTRLILDIFRNAAHTSEGKIQVEIAEIEHLQTRLAGRGMDLAQQTGYIGNRGPGETLKEQIRRYYFTKIRQAKKQLETLKKSREAQRKKRLASNIPLVCLVGYTNAGKSSLLNRLTKSDVLVEDKLFATLDPTTRSYYLTPEKKILLSDTVGFISQLPPQLIEAFKSTLDELRFASLLLVVVDITNEMWEDHIAVVKKIIQDLGVNKPIAYVFNKIDMLENPERLPLLVHAYQPHIFAHTLDKDGVADVVSFLQQYPFSDDGMHTKEDKAQDEYDQMLEDQE